MSQEFYRPFEPTPPQENVSIEDYNNALQRLTDFAQTDTKGIVTLEALSDRTQGIGSALRAVALTNGRFGLVYPTQLGQHSLTQSGRDCSLSLTVRRTFYDAQEYAFLEYNDLNCAGVFKDGYAVAVPTTAILATIDSHQAYSIVHAAKQRRQKLTFYYPLRSSRDVPGYADVVHHAVSDMLTIGLPSPTPISDAFRNSFNE